jgi:putative transposase
VPRKAREIEVNVPVHVTQRGNNRQDIFHDEEDKEFYILNFQLYKKKFRVKMYAWCLMDNHIHFVLEPRTKNGLAKLFGNLNTRYVRYYNRKYGIQGRLFESRYYTGLLTDGNHFIEALRYVELNPVRAFMVDQPEEYIWSSVQERYEIRNQYYLSSIPTEFEITDWRDFLLQEELNSRVWTMIRKQTLSTLNKSILA